MSRFRGNRGGGGGGGWNRGRGGGRGGGGGRGRGRGGYGGGFGGRGGYGDQGEPDQVIELGFFTHPCEDQLVVKSTIEQVPFFNAPIYLENKQQIGKIDEILGPIRNYYVSVKLSENVKATSFGVKQKLFIDPAKLLPLQRFLPKPPGAKIGKSRGGGAGRGGGRGGRGRGRGGFSRGGGFGRGGGGGGGGRGFGRNKGFGGRGYSNSR